MAVPKILTSWDVSVDGIGFLGICDKIKLPFPEEKEEEVWGCGTYASVKIPVGIQPMVCEMSFLEFNPLLYNLVGAKGNAAGVLLKGAMRNDEETIPLVALLHGRLPKIELDEFSMGSVPKQHVRMNVKRFALTIGSHPALLVDAENNILNTHNLGDVLEDLRSSIGL